MKSFRYINTFLVVLFFGVVSSVYAATFTVTNTNDSGAGSLRQAILDANDAATNDDINFDGGVFSTPQTITITSPLNVIGNGSLTINGPGANLLTIDGNVLTRGFTINAVGSATPIVANINNLTVSRMYNNSGNQWGSAIGVNPEFGEIPVAAEVNIDKVVLLNNVADGAGAGMGCRTGGAVINITNSEFRGNRANNGGGIETGSGFGDGCVWNIDRTLFEGNIATSAAGGGGISGSSNNDRGVFVTNSTFIRNESSQNGSAISLGFSGSQGVIENCTIAFNRTLTSGGAVRFSGWEGRLENTTIVNNSAQNPNSTGGISFINCVGCRVSIKNTLVANNTNTGDNQDIRGVGGGDTLDSLGYNFVENASPSIFLGDPTGNIFNADPKLNIVPRTYGGEILTIAPFPGSPIIDAGDPNNSPATDQRGIARPADGDGNGSAIPDIGAFEKRPSDIIPAQKFDFDGDGKTDIGIFRPNVGEWWYLRSSDLGNGALQFGSSTDVPTPADFTGDGKTDISFFRNGEWFVLRSEDDSFFSFPWGQAGDIPAPGDFDGDGKADPAVFRPNDTTWFILKSTDNNVDIIPFGIAEDKPVIADYDGDGKDDIAVYRPSVSEWWINQSTDGVSALQFGSAGDRTTQGDYTGDGKADVAFFRPTSGEWFIIRSEDFSFFSFPFGAAGDIPAPGDYDGDGTFDATVFRPTQTTWFINGTQSGVQIVGFGLNGDVPVPSVYSVE